MTTPIQPKLQIPWTAQIPSAIVTLLTLCTGGYFIIAVGVYLSFWVWRRRPSSYSFFFNAAFAVLVFLPLDFGQRWPTWLDDTISLALFAAFISAPFLLRRDLQKFFRETTGGDVEMKTGWLILFGAGYINYCLSVVFSGEGPKFGSSTSIAPSR